MTSRKSAFRTEARIGRFLLVPQDSRQQRAITTRADVFGVRSRLGAISLVIKVLQLILVSEGKGALEIRTRGLEEVKRREHNVKKMGIYTCITPEEEKRIDTSSQHPVFQETTLIKAFSVQRSNTTTTWQPNGRLPPSAPPAGSTSSLPTSLVVLTPLPLPPRPSYH